MYIYRYANILRTLFVSIDRLVVLLSAILDPKLHSLSLSNFKERRNFFFFFFLPKIIRRVENNIIIEGSRRGIDRGGGGRRRGFVESNARDEAFFDTVARFLRDAGQESASVFSLFLRSWKGDGGEQSVVT